MAVLQNPATPMISRENSQQILLRTQIPCTVDRGSTVVAQPMSCCFTGSPWMKMILGNYVEASLLRPKKALQTISTSLQVLWPSHGIQAASPPNAY